MKLLVSNDTSSERLTEEKLYVFHKSTIIDLSILYPLFVYKNMPFIRRSYFIFGYFILVVQYAFVNKITMFSGNLNNIVVNLYNNVNFCVMACLSFLRKQELSTEREINIFVCLFMVEFKIFMQTALFVDSYAK